MFAFRQTLERALDFDTRVRLRKRHFSRYILTLQYTDSRPTHLMCKDKAEKKKSVASPQTFLLLRFLNSLFAVNNVYVDCVSFEHS